MEHHQSINSIGEILKIKEDITVNSRNKSLNTVNGRKTISKQIDDFIDSLGITPEGVAQKIAEDLDDLDSLDYYLILAKENPAGRLLEAVHYVKDAARRGKIRSKKAVYFLGILRNWGIKTKFKKNDNT